ncbi:MAG TPA: hypothetical protein VKR59_21135 [Terriglobales bacterium]|nr:hypothetical protein [Terriglobales bacterium]
MRRPKPIPIDGLANQAHSCAELMLAAESELTAFMRAVTKLYGREQAGISADDWLDELASMHWPCESVARDLRLVTIRASARLANRSDALAA